MVSHEVLLSHKVPLSLVVSLRTYSSTGVAAARCNSGTSVDCGESAARVLVLRLLLGALSPECSETHS